MNVFLIFALKAARASKQLLTKVIDFTSNSKKSGGLPLSMTVRSSSKFHATIAHILRNHRS
jgi:hypothetical protein